MSDSDKGIDEAACDHLLVSFDEEKAKGLSSSDVRKRWPRFEGKCSCGFSGISYASFSHYLHGDW